MLQHLTADNSRDTGNRANKDKRSYLAELAPPLIIKPASYPQVQPRLACLAACWGERREVGGISERAIWSYISSFSSIF